MKLVLVIDGESADDLFTVGPKDLMNHFLPEHLGVKKEDVVICRFEEFKKDDKVLTHEEYTKILLSGKEYSVVTHKQNYERLK